MSLETTLAAIRPADPAAMAAARERQARLTKPAGSLGALEDLSVRLAGLAEVCPPPLPEPATVVVFAGDHGVHAQGVTPWPAEVTAQMVANFVGGGAVVNAFARQNGAECWWSTSAWAIPLHGGATLLDANIRRGTRDMTVEPAMTTQEARAAIEVGISVAGALADAGCALPAHRGHGHRQHHARGRADRRVHRRPAGPGDRARDGHRRRHVPPEDRGRGGRAGPAPADPADPLATLAAVGGLEHAALTGFILGAAERRIPVILDGVIAASAALVAAALAPDAVAAMVAGHRSAEPGATVALAHLGLEPLLDLGLRLGEGTGAVLALPIVASAVRVLHDVATFDSAGVSEK